jgi:hypothetical protein
LVPALVNGNYTVTFSTGGLIASTSFQIGGLALHCSSSSRTVGRSLDCYVTFKALTPPGTVSWSSSGGSFYTHKLIWSNQNRGFSRVRFTPSSVGSPVTITASYSGDSINPPSKASLGLKVDPKATSTYFGCKPTSVVAGSPTIVTCGALVIGYQPTGTVSWRQSSPDGGSFTLASTECSLSPRVLSRTEAGCQVTMTGTTAGWVMLQAIYKGDSNNLGSSRKGIYLRVLP